MCSPEGHTLSSTDRNPTDSPENINKQNRYSRSFTDFAFSHTNTIHPFRTEIRTRFFFGLYGTLTFSALKVSLKASRAIMPDIQYFF